MKIPSSILGIQIKKSHLIITPCKDKIGCFEGKFIYTRLTIKQIWLTFYRRIYDKIYSKLHPVTFDDFLKVKDGVNPWW